MTSPQSILAGLAERISSRSAVVGVVGLGYVGLPVACAFAAAGHQVVGVDLDEGRVDLINRGLSLIEADEPGLAELLAEVTAEGRLTVTTDPAVLTTADIVTINVQTPVDADNTPDLAVLEAAARSVGEHIQPATLVIVESTVPPGTTQNLVGPLVEKASGLRQNEEFFLGACPERVMPGRLLENIRDVARVCGGGTPEVAQTMKALYKTVVDAEVDLASITTAELVKVTENAYRDVQIAFANEVAQICSDLGEDVWQVRQLVNKVPERQMHRPGGGVGGHCIPKDTWLLADASHQPVDLLAAARRVNDSVPIRIARLVEEASRILMATGTDADRARTVLILGYSYLADSDDVRNSPSISLEQTLRDTGLEVIVHDPVVPGYDIPLHEATAKSAIAVKMVSHTRYSELEIDVPFYIDAQHLDSARQELSTLGHRDA